MDLPQFEYNETELNEMTSLSRDGYASSLGAFYSLFLFDVCWGVSHPK
jgi:hypothetical protein